MGDVDQIIVERLMALYRWPDGWVKRTLDVQELLGHPPIPEYVDDNKRERSVAWDLGRIRFFYDEIVAERPIDPIEIDNVCHGMHIYPEPRVLDGHHRLQAAVLAGSKIIPAYYGGRVDLLKYLTGETDKAPTD